MEEGLRSRARCKLSRTARAVSWRRRLRCVHRASASSTFELLRRRELRELVDRGVSRFVNKMSIEMSKKSQMTVPTQKLCSHDATSTPSQNKNTHDEPLRNIFYSRSVHNHHHRSLFTLILTFHKSNPTAQALTNNKKHDFITRRQTTRTPSTVQSVATLASITSHH